VLRTDSFEADAWPGLAERLARIPDVEEIVEEEMQELAGTETPQGILLVAEEPRPDVAPIWSDARARVVVLDGLQDPGNVGTLIRVAAAFDCSAVVALEGTSDPWSPKALRAAAGTTFRLPVLQEAWSVVRERLDGWSGALLLADAGGKPVGSVTGSEPWALVLGAEGSGCRPDVRARADATVSVPMPGGVESLNVGVAGALLLYELTRDRGVESAAPAIPRRSST
jgi:TrmH family RNA methyltransferase